jgi:hypothetical protein
MGVDTVVQRAEMPATCRMSRYPGTQGIIPVFARSEASAELGPTTDSDDTSSRDAKMPNGENYVLAALRH